MKVPKGTSEYQATWIVEDDGDDEDENDLDSCEDHEDDMMGEDEENDSQVTVIC